MFAEIIERRELIRNLVGRELKSRYKGSILGVMWSVLTPLFMAMVYFFFFRLLIGRGVPAEGIIIGVFAWTFTVHSTNTGMLCISGNANLVKKVKFPRFLLPFSVTLSGLSDYAISLLIQFTLIAVLLVYKGYTDMLGIIALRAVLLMPLVIVMHSLFNFGLALITSASNVYFRDTQHLVGVWMSAWFFMSPLMYDLDFVAQRVGPARQWIVDLFMLNPMSVIATAYRAILLPRVVFPWNAWSVTGLLITLLLPLVAYLVFQRAQRNFADYV